MSRNKIRLISGILAVFPLLVLFSSCAPKNDLDDRINQATDSFRFSLLSWEAKTLAGDVGKLFSPNRASDNTTALEKRVKKQVREVLSEQGIYNPADKFFKLKVGFPPVTLYLGNPLHLLVVSPRDRIESIGEVTLIPEMNEKDMEGIEAKIESLGYSALVVELGGMATFPSYVSNDTDMKFIIESTAHEWAHQYLAFTPLGFLYVLDETGLRQNYDVATINETVADIIGREIGDMVYQKYYAPPPASSPAQPAAPGFDFNGAMREIRKTVDAYLARGEIVAAEKYMNERQQYLADNGYYIRKLNQAYFAFYGTYADSPTSISPIGQELKTLRSQSASLKDFLDRVTSITSRAELDATVR
jgi:hypothetical protein